MTDNLDMTDVNSPEFFTEMTNNLVYPSKPKKPFLKREDYETNKEYHIACAEAEDAYEIALKKYKDDIKKYQIENSKIDALFWKWALDRAGLGNLPESVRGASQYFAYEAGHSGGLHEMYNSLLDISDLVRTAYVAGQNSVKKD